jgi:hypothetical protein
VALRGIGPARAEEALGRRSFRAVARERLGDRLQCSLRSGPAAAAVCLDAGGGGNEMLCVGGGDGDAAWPVFAGARRCSVGNNFLCQL